MFWSMLKGRKGDLEEEEEIGFLAALVAISSAVEREMMSTIGSRCLSSFMALFFSRSPDLYPGNEEKEKERRVEERGST